MSRRCSCRSHACCGVVRYEIGVDCGGPDCAGCPAGTACTNGFDCASTICTKAAGAATGTCAASSCFDGVTNGPEVRVIMLRAWGRLRRHERCAVYHCLPPQTDVDCGGPVCNKCAVEAGCAKGSDCGSGVCVAGACEAPTCSDGVANGAETDVDCGGPACGKCGNLLFCTANDHCLSGVCTLGACSLPNCQDGVANGLEVRAGAPLPGTG